MRREDKNGRLKTLCLVVMISLFSLSAITYGGITWTTKRLTRSLSFISKYPAIAVEGSNSYVVWDDKLSDYEIYLKQSDDDGAAWVQQRLTWRDSYSITPDVAVNGLNIYVIWRESSLSHSQWAIYLKMSDDGGITWLYKNLSGFGGLQTPKVSVDGSNVYVVWGSCQSVYFTKSIDGGATWETVQTLSYTTSAPFCSEPEMAVDGPNIYIVWNGFITQGNNDIFLIKSTDGGATWESEKRLSQTSKLSLRPAIAVNGQNIYVVWQENDSEIYFMQSTDGGGTWEAQKRITWTAGLSIAPKIAAQGSNIKLGS